VRPYLSDARAVALSSGVVTPSTDLASELVGRFSRYPGLAGEIRRPGCRSPERRLLNPPCLACLILVAPTNRKLFAATLRIAAGSDTDTSIDDTTALGDFRVAGCSAWRGELDYLWSRGIPRRVHDSPILGSCAQSAPLAARNAGPGAVTWLSTVGWRAVSRHRKQERWPGCVSRPRATSFAYPPLGGLAGLCPRSRSPGPVPVRRVAGARPLPPGGATRPRSDLFLFRH
jgi:hypothetical protein